MLKSAAVVGGLEMWLFCVMKIKKTRISSKYAVVCVSQKCRHKIFSNVRVRVGGKSENFLFQLIFFLVKIIFPGR